MQFYLETPLFIVFYVSLFLPVTFFLLTIYYMKKNEFYTKVNCWFCNTSSSVLYKDRNSFECIHCTQYNGFKEDGSYNKVIKAQHDISGTKFTSQKTEYYENGLCTYCNNNQQLKIYQLAKFTPINEDNYDIEVEHFRKQLEKAYKLCKKCDQTLKTTLNRKHSWLFGNRLKDLKRRGFAYLNQAKVSKQVNESIFLKFLRISLIISTAYIVCNILHIRIVYPQININKYLPQVFNPYKSIILDYYNEITNHWTALSTEIYNLNSYFNNNIKINISRLTVVSFISFIFDLILSFGKKIPLIWKIYCSISWIIMSTTLAITFSHIYGTYISFLQVCTLLTLLYNYIWSTHLEQAHNSKEFQFKKIVKPAESLETSEDERDEHILRPLNLQARPPTSNNLYRCSSDDQILNNSFSTAKSVTSTSEFFNSNISSDLNRSLDNLHLNVNPQRCTSPIFSVNSAKRPVVSPAKLKNITQNPWTAGGFWKNENHVLSAVINPTNMSRSSSQTSGFVSNPAQDINSPFRSLPGSREASLNGDVDRVSVLSEPLYNFSPISPSLNTTKTSQLYYKADNNIFYPVLSQNNMLFIQNGIPLQRFDSLNNTQLFRHDNGFVANNQYSSKNPNSPNGYIRNDIGFVTNNQYATKNPNSPNGSIRSLDNSFVANNQYTSKNPSVPNGSFRNVDSLSNYQPTKGTIDGSIISPDNKTSGINTRVLSPDLGGERPISGLFKNLNMNGNIRPNVLG
ncbi:uncharacterized protein [Diabrotica undecimpunctata]|uniref:uncharacterized protein n=1 Tax=Diabrotica undecimpunctata TaxID=50387 RepID=UPI003B641D8E